MSQVKQATAASYNLSEDLLMEIMKRLPVKSILCCRCVRKSWYRLLRSPYFISLHSRHQNSLHKYLLFFNRKENYFSLRFDDEQCKEYCELRVPRDMNKYCVCSDPIVYETCNGVICLSSLSIQKVWLWNPALRAFDVLPDSPIPTSDSFTKHNITGLAFGYLAKTNDYKVIKYEKYYRHTKTEFYVYVYSLSTDSWKTVKTGECGESACFKVSNSVVVNDVAYWAASYLLWGSERVIVCFDMGNDTIREIRLPPPLNEEYGSSIMLVENSIFGELLSLFYYDRLTHTLHIWELEYAGDENEVWTYKKSLNYQQIRHPAGFRNNGELVLRSAGKFLSYDLEKNKEKDIVDDDSLDAFYWYGGKFPYPHQGLNRFEETLVLLDVNR